jgi:hypothetical protein
VRVCVHVRAPRQRQPAQPLERLPRPLRPPPPVPLPHRRDQRPQHRSLLLPAAARRVQHKDVCARPSAAAVREIQQPLLQCEVGGERRGGDATVGALEAEARRRRCRSSSSVAVAGDQEDKWREGAAGREESLEEGADLLQLLLRRGLAGLGDSGARDI